MSDRWKWPGTFLTQDEVLNHFVSLVNAGRFRGIVHNEFTSSSDDNVVNSYDGYSFIRAEFTPAGKNFYVEFPDGRYFELFLPNGGRFEIEEVEMYEEVKVERKFRSMSDVPTTS